MEDFDLILQEYVATANNPDYNGDYSIINSKFPELTNIDPKVLEEYVLTANNPEYNQDWDLINSKFPEFNIESESEDILSATEYSTPSDVITSDKYDDESYGFFGLINFPIISSLSNNFAADPCKSSW